MIQPMHCRTIWISDVHLGTRACKADSLLDFLRHHIAHTLYLVGDIVDGWNWGPSWYWSEAQQELVNEIVQWRHRGAEVVFLPGNHDESKLSLVEQLFGSLPSKSSLIHTTADGKRMLVIHGHQFDGSLNPNRLLPIIGANAYARAQRIHDWYNRGSSESGEEGRSFSDFFRYPARKAVEFFTDFRDRAVLAAARDHKADGVICGHIHRADHRRIGSILYVNDGDWVQNRTAVMEETNGTLQVLRWHNPNVQSIPTSEAIAEAASL
jgi:UDP-2,3-diacylglucosamine pyrophosphatase LpxH